MPVLAFMNDERQASKVFFVPFLTFLVSCGPGSNPIPPVPEANALIISLSYDHRCVIGTMFKLSFK